MECCSLQLRNCDSNFVDFPPLSPVRSTHSKVFGMLLFSTKKPLSFSWVTDLYVLAIIKTTETYDNIRESLADLRVEMSNLKEIGVNNCTYQIEYFLGGDWKFLALVD